MLDRAFYELMLDNISDGVYILDNAGNYLYVNSVYVQMLGMSKTELLNYNVHEFLSSNQINFCISDIVYREKRRVVVFQDVAISNSKRSEPFRHLVVSTPVFGADGEVQNIIAVCKPLNAINDFYNEAMANSASQVCVQPNSFLMDDQETIVAVSPAMKNLLQVAHEIAGFDTSVLVSGESGTGKEVIAQYIHGHSSRADHGMVVINCASLPENLLEAELFGYEKGAFTGASAAGKKGLIEAADQSSLFLDEINSLPLPLQGKLLRALETKTIQRVGSTAIKKVDFRLISATNEDLRKAVEEKRFRADLFYRLNVIPLEIAPLRARTEDILPLALHFLNFYNKKYTKSKIFTENTIQKMQNYSWPGNVRELKNFVERSVVMSASDRIEITNIQSIAVRHSEQTSSDESSASALVYPPMYQQLWGAGPTLQEYLERCEREYIQYALNTYKSTYAAAAALGTSQSSIMRRKQKYFLS